MGLIRMITIAAILYLVYKAARYFTDQGRFPVKRHQEGKNNQNKADSSQNKSENEMMVACQYCDVRLPKAQAIKHKEHWFCNQEHLKAYEDTNSD